VRKLIKEDIDIIRQYLLSFDEAFRENIRSTISATMLKYLTIVENGFINDHSTERISSELGIEQSQELRALKIEYLTALAQASIEKGSNVNIDKINIIGNKSYQKILKEISDVDAFEKDMTIAIKLLERNELKRMLEKYDEEDEFDISDHEIKTAIAITERDEMRKRFKNLDDEENNIKKIKLIFRYAIAAAVIGIILSSSYFLLFKQEEKKDIDFAQKDSITKSNVELALTDLPNLIELNHEKQILINGKISRGFAVKNDSITIETYGLLRQIDTLQKIVEELQNQSVKESGLVENQITLQIDSLQSLLNKYTYNPSSRKVKIYLPKATQVKNVITIDQNKSSKLYISIKGEYFIINTNTIPAYLIPIKDRNTIDSLNSIEFLNE
jgi:hypothetical protein